MRLRDILRRSGSIVTEKRDYSHAVARSCGTTRAHAYIYIYEMCVQMCLRGMELCNGQRLQVLDSRESTNEHKTCQQPWEVGRVSAVFLIRSMFALYRGSRRRSREVSDHLPERSLCTNSLLLIIVCYSWHID